MKKLSIIICTYNRPCHLVSCVEEVVKQVESCSEMDKRLVELVIVDNNSSDKTSDIIKNITESNEWVIYVRESKQGLSHARNCGAEVACGEYLCYLDDDARPGVYYVSNVLSVLNAQSPHIMGGPVYPFYSTKKPFWFSDSLETRCHSSTTGFADCLISGGNYIIRKELLFQLGMFSSDYGMIGNTLRLGEERELLERYKRSIPKDQSRIYYSLECCVLHHVPEYKMSLGYFVKRAYKSGKMLEKINGDRSPKSSDRMNSAEDQAILINLIQRTFQKSEVNILLRILHKSAKAVGIGMQCISNMKRSSKHSNLSA